MEDAAGYVIQLAYHGDKIGFCEEKLGKQFAGVPSGRRCWGRM